MYSKIQPIIEEKSPNALIVFKMYHNAYSEVCLDIHFTYSYYVCKPS